MRAVERALNRLAQAGKVSKPRKGYYEVNRDGDSAIPPPSQGYILRAVVGVSEDVVM